MVDVLVVGTGQLGLMMAAAGARFGLSVDRLDPVSGEILPGTSKTRIGLGPTEIAARYPLITAELEHLPDNPLMQTLSSHPGWCNAHAMATLPARNRQKALLDELALPTAPWCELVAADDVKKTQARLGPLVIKSIRGGYDGKGQWHTDTDPEQNLGPEMIGRCIAEQKIAFTRELSIIGARFPDGAKFFYPLTENYHQQGMLRYSFPATNAVALQGTAEEMLARLMDNLNYTGVIAAECFDTPQGLLINEIAPRVHNSGHWTQSGMDYSQFDLHLFAVLGKQPPSRLEPRFTLMLNLIGCQWHAAWQALPNIQCYWYGKSWRANRKLGHINIGGTSVAELLSHCRTLMPYLDTFHQSMLERGMGKLKTED